MYINSNHFLVVIIINTPVHGRSFSHGKLKVDQESEFMSYKNDHKPTVKKHLCTQYD